MPGNGTAPCYSEKYWMYFLSSTLISFFGGILTILTWRLIDYFLDHFRETPSVTSPTYINIKRKCQYLVSGRTTIGRILVSVSCCLSIGSLLIYLVEASEMGRLVESCGAAWETHAPVFYLDSAFNALFLLLFIIRFLAADDKLRFWFSLNSLVDYCTIPPSFISVILSRQWLGLRFMRAFRILSIPDMFQYLKILKASPTIRFSQLVAILTSTMLAAAGFIHLLELSGDVFNNFENAQRLSYWECLYLIVVTMSTVGYGDVTAKTVCGRIFISFFILAALASIASFVPEVAELVGHRKRRFKNGFQVEAGSRHIVVCGNLSYHCLYNFLRDFLHEDRRETKTTKVVILDDKPLTLDIEALVKGYFTRVVFIKGSPLDVDDLQRAEICEADACIIVANQKSTKPDSDDARNIMNVISIKQFSPTTRVILQLLKSQNKKYFENLPWWNQHVDQTVCMSQVKLGLMAAGSLIPGFSTLLANLVFTLSFPTSRGKEKTWLHHYCIGASMEIYKSHFSASLTGKTFEEIAKICFHRLNLMLIGITKEESGEVFVNPSCIDFIIQSNSFGLFICQDETEVQRVQHFCQFCHSDVTDVKRIKKCKCPGQESLQLSGSSAELISKNSENSGYNKNVGAISQDSMSLGSNVSSSDLQNYGNKLNDHIVVCAGKVPNFSELKNFIKILKVTNREKNGTIVSLTEDSDSHWEAFCKSEHVFFKKGSALMKKDLEEIAIEKCKVCVVLSGVQEEVEDTDQNVDTHSILTTLYIKHTIADISFNGDLGAKEPMILTEIVHDANAKFIDYDADRKSVLYLAKSFASGHVFGTSVLDAFISMIYCNPGAYRLIEALMNVDETQFYSRNEIRLLSIKDKLLLKNKRLKYNLHSTYGDIFMNSLSGNGILCLGLYRLFRIYSEGESTKKPRKYSKRSIDRSREPDENERFVLTNPPGSTYIHDTDLIYCIIPTQVLRREDQNKKNDTTSV